MKFMLGVNYWGRDYATEMWRHYDGAVIFLFTHGLNFGEDITNLKPIGLDADAIYSVEGKTVSGDTLMKYGLNIETPRGDYQSKIIEIRKSDGIQL